MRIAIVGAGGVGGYFGGLLARQGHHVTFVARGEHARAMRREGLRLRRGGEDIHIPRVEVLSQPERAEPVDVVLFCVKAYDTESAALAWQGLLKPGTLWLTLQNGVDSFERLAGIMPAHHVVPGAAYVSAVIAAPGVIACTGSMSGFVFGERAPSGGGRCARFAAACAGAGFEATVSSDIGKELWTKFIALATNAALTGVTRQPAGVVYRLPELLALARVSAREIVAVAGASGIGLDQNAEEQALRLLSGLPAGMYASLYHDLAGGRPIENAVLSGFVSRAGARLGIPTPFHDFAHACLKPYEARACGREGGT